MRVVITIIVTGIIYGIWWYYLLSTAPTEEELWGDKIEEVEDENSK